MPRGPDQPGPLLPSPLTTADPRSVPARRVVALPVGGVGYANPMSRSRRRVPSPRTTALVSLRPGRDSRLQYVTMVVNLRYGRGDLTVKVPSTRVTVLAPTFVPGLADEAQSFREAVNRPIGARPLRECTAAGDRVAIVIPDLTRPLPSDRLLPWLLAEFAHVPDDRVTIINGTGSHRANTEEELRSMVGAEILRRHRVVNHSAYEPDGMALAGTTPDGHPVFLNREWVEADRRIVVGFIEPHFMAGFSGGYKGVFPGIADIESIMRYHRAEVIGDPRSTWGVLEGNPTQNQIRANGALCPVDFCVNLTLNRDRAITGFFCGDPIEAHRAGRAVRAGHRDGRLPAPLCHCPHNQQRLPARPEPVPDGEGPVRGRADRAAGRLHPCRIALQRRIPGARQFPAPDDQLPRAASDPGRDPHARLQRVRPVGGATAGDDPAEGARRLAQRDSRGPGA